MERVSSSVFGDRIDMSATQSVMGSSRGLCVDSSTSLVETRCNESPETPDESNNTHKNFMRSRGASVDSTPLMDGGLGKQMGATEIGNEISSRALLNVDDRFMQNIPRNSSITDDLCSIKDSHSMLCSTHDAPLTLRKPLTPLQAEIIDKDIVDVTVCLEQYVNDGDKVKAFKESPNVTPKKGLVDICDSSTNTLEQMLCDASRHRGIRLSWLLYSVMFVILFLITLLAWQIRWEVWNNTDVKLTQMTALTVTNRLELIHQSIKDMVPLLGMVSSSGMHVIHSHLCSSLGGAAVVYASYDRDNSSLLWSRTCYAVHPHLLPPQLLPTNTVERGIVNIAEYHSDYIIAWGALDHSDEGTSAAPGYFAIVLDKKLIKRLLLFSANSFYSPFVEKHISTAFLLPDFESTKMTLALHSLSEEYGNYSVTQSNKPGRRLHSTFDRVCKTGKTNTWHTVFRPGRDYSSNWDSGVNKALSDVSEPFAEYKGPWGSPSNVVMCGVVCFHQSSDTCSEGNPSSVWFIVDSLPPMRESNNAVTLMVLVSVFVIILFATMVLVAYLSISVPVQHLKFLVFSAVGDKRAKTRRENLLLRYTQPCWLDDLTDLVRTVQLLSFCFQLNKKYVPQHVLEKQAYDLQNDKNYLWSTIVEDGMSVAGEEEEMDDEGAPGDQDELTAFVNTVSREQMQDLANREAFSPFASIERRENSFSGLTLQTDGEGSEGNAITGVPHGIEGVDRGMTIVDTATILTVHLSAVEMAYFTNCKLAVKKHRRIMNLLLGRIRYYRGEPFVRSGDCIAASWNAFESRADHAQRAAACAQSIAKSLALYRQAGFRVGIVLHQGPFICGLFQDNKEAFTTVFGSVPRQAIALAELAASLPWFSLLLTEPVKQSLSSLYECIMVDAIKYHEDETPIAMFELIGEPRSHNTPKEQKGTPIASSSFAAEYARVFFDFRNHEFTRALDGIQQLRVRFPTTASQLLERLELLCRHYATRPEKLPLPYFRPYPTWVNYEAIASADAALEHCPQRSLDDPLFPTHLPRHVAACKSIYEDDVIGFRRELHDNVLASRRTVNSMSPTKTSRADTLRSSSLSKATPRPETSVEKRSLAPTPLDGFALPPAATEFQRFTDETLDPREEELKSNCQPPPCTQVCADALTQGAHGDGVENDHRGSGSFDTTGGSDFAIGALFAKDSGSVKHAVSMGSKGQDSVLSLCTPTERVKEDDAQDGSERQRFSLTNCLSEAAVEHGSRTVLGVLDSFVSINSKNFANAPSMSIKDPEGSLSRVSYELPREIFAKNGITYLRSSRILGKGSFGCVYLGMDVSSSRLVAIKFLPLPSEEEEVSNIETEVVTMQKVKSSHVVEFISYAFQDSLVILVMECMLAGSLNCMLFAFKSMPTSSARLFIRDVLRGLHKLHSSGIIHRDVKPQNVLLTLSGCCKISDFGASAFLQELVRKQMEGNGLQVQGTPLYLAPEAARGVPEASSDIWSCGIMFIQLVTGEMAYASEFLSMPPQVLVFQIGSGAAKPIIPDTLDEFDEEFLRHCLQVDPNDRLSAQRLLELPIFAL